LQDKKQVENMVC